MRYFTLLIFALASLPQLIFAQGELGVDMYTGKPQISIPLVTVGSHEISDPVSLVYDAGGVRVQQTSGSFGIGWGLQAGGSISRQVRGLPDEYDGTGSDARRGWFYNSAFSFGNASDTVASTTTGESTDYSQLNGFSYNYDTEPDIFSYNFGPYSGQFIFNNSTSPTAHLVPYTDLKISWSIGSSTFTITTHDGTIYTFAKALSQTRATTKVPSGVEFLQRDFSLYDYSRYSNYVGYYIEWKLTQVQSPLGATISYSYASCSNAYSLDTVRVSVQSYTVPYTYTTERMYTDTRHTSATQLTQITASTGTSVYFTYTGGCGVGQVNNIAVYDTRRPTTYVQQFDLAYTTTGADTATRYFLQTLTQSSGCDKMPPYTFSYINAVGGSGSPSMYLPSVFSKSIDFWGYYNAKPNTMLAPTLYYYTSYPNPAQVKLYEYGGGYSTMSGGADRTPSAVAMQIGTLNNIQWPQGGSTSIQYEPHQYYDPLVSQSFIGGGLRVKSVTYYNGIDTYSNISKNFVYTDSTGNSSGRLISQPSFAVPVMQYKDPATNTPETETDWSYLMARTENDISPQETTHGSPVGYQEVKVYRSGSGYARYQFLMPATYGTYRKGNWNPTRNKFARSNTSSTLGPVAAGGPWMYPYAPNMNFDHERGLVWQVREYNETGTVVRWTRDYYQYLYKTGLSNPDTIAAVSYDHFPNTASYNIYFFGYYKWITNMAKVLQSEKVITYDENAITKNRSTLTEYMYGSSFHKLLTQTRQTTADGTAYSTYVVYPLDYGTIPSGSDTTSQMIGSLQTNFRNGTPIEQYSTFKKSGGTEYVTGGSVVRFNNFGTGNVLPLKQYSLNLASPMALSAFKVSHVDGTSKTFKIDSLYETAQTYLDFDSYGNPQSAVGMDRTTSATGWGYTHSLPVVSARNADATQFAFSDFETTTGLEFSVTGNAYYGTGHTGTNAIYPGVSLSKTLTKAPVTNYILSFWVNSTASISFTPTLKDASSTTQYSTAFTVPSSGGVFTYYRVVIPVTGVTSSTMSLTLTTTLTGTLSGYTVGALAPGLQPVIDEVSFYPENADLTSYTYTIPYGVNAATAKNQTVYTVFDNLGRKKYTLDTYKNIRQKYTYHFATDPPVTLDANFSSTGTTPSGLNTVATFAADGNCTDGVTYQWQINGGSWVTGTTTYSYTFTTAGTYKVVLKVSQPLYATKRDSININIALPSCTSYICAAGASAVTVCASNNKSVATMSYVCSGVTAPSHASGTTFAIYGISVSETITGYQWYQRTSGTGPWGAVGTSSTYTVPLIESGDSRIGYDVMCTITTNTGRLGSSTVMSVEITTSCP